MKKRDFVLISTLTIAALIVSYLATYESYCGSEGCSSWGGFPFKVFTPGGAGFGNYLNIPGVVGNLILYFGIFFIIKKTWWKIKNNLE